MPSLSLADIPIETENVDAPIHTTADPAANPLYALVKTNYEGDRKPVRLGPITAVQGHAAQLYLRYASNHLKAGLSLTIYTADQDASELAVVDQTTGKATGAKFVIKNTRDVADDDGKRKYSGGTPHTGDVVIYFHTKNRIVKTKKDATDAPSETPDTTDETTDDIATADVVTADTAKPNRRGNRTR